MSKISRAIVCIDDEKLVLDSLKSQLRIGLRDDYIIEVAEDAFEGIEVIDELMQDNIQVLVIISDWLMPKMNGDEFLVRVHKKYPLIIKVMLTGYADENAVQNAFDNANLYKLLHKPWNKKDLITVIKSVAL